MTKSIELPHARLEDLSRLHDFVEAACREVGADEDIAYALRLAMEEVCTNIITHGYTDQPPGPITLTIQTENAQIAMTIADRARPFSPDDAPPPDLSTGWDNRQVGGLGWFLIRKMTDEVHHEPNPGGGNRVTLIKKLK
jgi:serine/threonine-protein kinase RsbW